MTAAQQRAFEQFGERYLLQPPAAGRLDPVALFGSGAPLTVEVGFGNGDNLLSRAGAEPDRSFLGIEVHRPGVGRLMDRAAAAGIEHLRVACHDAVEVLRDWLEPGCVDELQVLFPDPWHKKRHNKRRLVSPAFLDIAHAALKPGGQLLLATDWADYADQMRELLSADDRYTNLSPSGDTVPRPESRPITRFEARGHRLGHEVFDFAFRREA